MSFRTTAALFGILIGVLMVFGLMLTQQKHKLDPGFIIPTLAREKDPVSLIGTVVVNYSGKKYTFFERDGIWRLRAGSEKEDVRADKAKVEEIIRDVSGARKSDEADITRNLAQWGLEEPSGHVTLKARGGDREWTLYLGRPSVDKGYYYVNSSDRKRDVLAVKRDQLVNVLIDPKDINKYRSTRLLDASAFSTTALKLSQPREAKGPVLALEKTKQGTWWFKTPAYGPAELEGSSEAKGAGGVRGLINAADAIRAEGDKGFEPIGQNVFPEAKALLRVEVERTEDGIDKKARTIKEVLLIGDKVAGKEEYYARLVGDQAVVRVDARNVETLLNVLKNPDSLRSRDLAQLDPARPDVVRVSRGKGLTDVTTLYKPGPGWKVVSGTLRHTANESAIQGPDGLLAALQGKGKVAKFLDVADEAGQGAARDKELGLDSPLARVEVWIDGLDRDAPKKSDKKDDKSAKKDEKKDAGQEEPRLKPDVKPALKLTFAKKEDKEKGTTVFVRREAADGTVSRVAVPASVLDKILPPEGALAYLDPNLAPFLPSDVTKLELKSPGQTFVTTREEKEKKAKAPAKGARDKAPEPDATWVLLEPKNFKDRPHADAQQVELTLFALTGLSARRYVERVDAKTDLSVYGLTKPAVIATVTLKKKEGQKEPTTHVFQFGSDVPKAKGGPGVYGIITAGSDLKDIVFVAPEHVVRTLKEVELRDRTVFKFDADKVKAIKLAIVEKRETREPVFERKDKGWAVKSGVGRFTLDSGRVEELVNELSALKAERYVGFAGPQKQHELGAKAPLKVEVLMDDGKTRYTLELGAAEGTTHYFAQSNTLPGAVFTVPQARFKPILDNGVSYFSKAE